VRLAKRLAFLGPAGTHTEQACLNYDSEATRVPFGSNTAVATAVASGLADEGVVPIENSQEGPVNETLDLLIHGSALSIRHELVVPIKNYLLSGEEARPEDIKVVYSHPQALAQCRSFLSKCFPEADLVASMSTAAAVEEMLARGPDAAAIATKRASELYGAKVLAEEIEDNPNNVTRFVVLSPEDHPATGADKTSVCFSFDGDAPGILHSVLGEFAERRINLAKIESRPTGESLGRYIFLVDLEGHRTDPEVQEALRGVKSKVSTFKVFGSYPRYSHPV
jgi:prephenate dehydratase